MHPRVIMQEMMKVELATLEAQAEADDPRTESSWRDPSQVRYWRLVKLG
jgi:hypothetical protein